MFDSIINSQTTTTTLSMGPLLICTLVSLLLGIAISVSYMHKNQYSKNFVVTLALLPAMVQAVITLVNGNLGAGVAVMGTFTLVRFRSVPGTSKEIGAIFLAMAVGLATGMGYIGYAAIFTLIIIVAMACLNIAPFGEQRDSIKELKVIIPENLDYTHIFDDLFDEFTQKATLTKVKTTNMGSLYQLFYTIELKDPTREKELIDGIRCRNGNMNIICGRRVTVKEEL